MTYYYELRITNAVSSNYDTCACASAFFPLPLLVLFALASLSRRRSSCSLFRRFYDICFALAVGSRCGFNKGGRI
jgi:uncharacterized protein (TIGR03382 family)